MLFLQLGLTILIAYIIGSIPTGYLIVKGKTGQDIRTIGSGSTGATNVKRVLGKKWFFAVMLLDALKGATPVLLAKYLTYDPYGINAVLASIFVIIGHSKPILLIILGSEVLSIEGLITQTSLFFCK